MTFTSNTHFVFIVNYARASSCMAVLYHIFSKIGTANFCIRNITGPGIEQHATLQHRTITQSNPSKMITKFVTFWGIKFYIEFDE